MHTALSVTISDKLMGTTVFTLDMEGIGSFGTRGTFSHLLFFLYVLGSGWWADLLKYRGTPAQIFV